MPKVYNDDTRITAIDVIWISWDQCDTPHATIICWKTFCTIKMVSYGNRLFNSINYMFGCLIDLKFLFALWKYPLEGVPKNMCLKHIGKIVEKN